MPMFLRTEYSKDDFVYQLYGKEPVKKIHFPDDTTIHNGFHTWIIKRKYVP